MIPGNDAGDAFFFVEGILVIKEELVSFAAGDDLPLALGSLNMDLTILMPARNTILLAELINAFLLFPQPCTYHGTAVTHTVSCHPSLFFIEELLLVLFANTAVDRAVRKMEYFLSAFYAVEYHEWSTPFFV